MQRSAVDWAWMTAATAIVVTVFATPLKAQEQMNEQLGSGLSKLCSQRNLGFAALCDGYILGTVDMYKAMQVNDQTCQFDLPPGTSREEISIAARSYLENHPEQGEAPSWALIILAMKEAYPCP